MVSTSVTKDADTVLGKNSKLAEEIQPPTKSPIWRRIRFPTIQGVIDRRILVNYRVDPDVLMPLLPKPFRPKLIQGFGMVGICLIRLKYVRPKGFPTWFGVSSENAAHRTAVEWGENSIQREGVFVRQRDTNSWFNTVVGGRLFPGMHYHACFEVQEDEEQFTVAMRSDDGYTSLSVRGRRVDTMPDSSVFRSVEEASEFFARGSLGYSPTSDPTRFQGLELQCRNWQVESLAVDEVRSSFFDDKSVFPKGCIEFDCALLMRGIEHEWHSHEDLCCRM